MQMGFKLSDNETIIEKQQNEKAKLNDEVKKLTNQSRDAQTELNQLRNKVKEMEQ